MSYGFVTGASLLRTTGLPSATNVTFTAWVKRLSTGLDIVFQINNAGGALYNDHLLSGSTAQYGAQGNGTTVQLIPRVPNVPSAWFFIAGSCSGTAVGTLIAYMSALGSDELLKVAANPTTAMTVTQMWLGTDDVNNFFHGRIAFVKVWDAVLRPAEILREKYSIVPKRLANLHLCSPLRFSPRDISGRGRDWTVGGSPLLLADEPLISWDADIDVAQRRSAVKVGIAAAPPTANPSQFDPELIPLGWF